ncbi:MAG TPA: hypothetical protein VJU87_06915 [Gemmatimonadaceae bacterium]|nr:hypothetical protein [Gemmatimonadaceae bacterium]
MLAWSPAGAQDSTSGAPHPPALSRVPIACAGQRIDSISIHSSAPSVALVRRVPFIAELARSFHRTTRPEVIRRFLLLAEGERCSEARRAESERILRAQPFLADAAVVTYPDDEGGVVLDVRTIDETSIVLGGAARSSSPFITGARFGSSNVDGEGIYLAGDWRHDRVFRDGYGGQYNDYQFAGRPYILSFGAHRNPLGGNWGLEAAHPFLTDFQRIAWRARTGSSDDMAEFEPVPDLIHGVRVRREYFDVGGIVRIGPPGRLSLFGASVSGDRDRPASIPELITPDGLEEDTSSVLRDRYEEHRIARVNALWGVRDIQFVRVQGFDALTATQDLPVGFQLGTLFGRSLSVLGSHDDDIFMSADLYVGASWPDAALRIQLQGEGRRSNDQNLWDGILTSGRAAQYVKIAPDKTLIISSEWSGGWRMRIPFGLTLGEFPGGLRGYAGSRAPGGQRLIGRIEQRWIVGRPFQLGDLGIAAFTDAGRLWAGDVPFGRSTPVRSSVGMSILAAVPARSARLWRLDIAVPLSRDPTQRVARVELRISSEDRTAFFWRQPADVDNARERTVPTSIFNWP